ncbi:PREDICTED: methyltransferase-like protein 25 isoform X2 [Polistes dominula]|uniref:Methyltransferase-like protein 25 isoform X2 n=1 Tax=Polistes dominula TaxID=743375 RepID=A0ABM1JAF7_POLDO|nr:PREDICTED: methyltransferase-like protein 25 isoform X2 [Polistes dominula]
MMFSQRDEELLIQYFLEALCLFHKTQWIYNHPVTEILINGSLDAIPKEWLDVLQSLSNNKLNNFVVNKTLPVWPKTLQEFIDKCKYTNRLSRVNPSTTLKVPQQFIKRLNPKKQHEIIHLAELIHAQCKTLKIEVIVDFGSGLGYVSQLLYHLYGYKVLGLDGNEANITVARNRQMNIYPTSVNHVKYAYCKLSCHSIETIETIESLILSEFGKIDNLCFIGLHACGDLSVYVSKIFNHMKNAQLLILISCCYHKLTVSKNENVISNGVVQHFDHFPMSQCLKKAIDYSNLDTSMFLRQPFLRLACQEPAERWINMSQDSHDIHAFHVLARAVFELYVNQNKLYLKKQVRKATRLSQCSSIENYVKDTLLRYTLEPINETVPRNEEKLNDHELIENEITELWKHHCQRLQQVEIYTGLQLILQASAESMVLQDRLCWLREQGLNAIIIPVMNNILSPRSNAIVAQKQ